MKKLIAGLVLSAVSSVWAADVSQMAILGIKLGDKYENIKNKLPCQNRTTAEEVCYDGGNSYTLKTKSFHIFCDSKSSSKEESFQASYDNQRKVYNLYRYINFLINPDWESIETDLIKLYGQPDFKHVGKYYNGIDNGRKVYDSKTSYCWGNCQLSENGSYYSGNALSITIIVNNIGYNGMVFNMTDSIKKEQNEAENKMICQKQIKQQKDEASKINF